ncbi:hypothetical protein DNK06_08820 [Pseudomonas daroniae]|uniref:Uncharacterized protein n=1 Tax=Phytopseudomonas daroniae TaxID=2487519 RepID=A0A4V2KAY6_9GAMM|nr:MULTISPECIES: hypothetical protein [Pseudomonas]TBU81202.1 hypothetical protein DNK06_08820 [Pseudomonas daroniae]TBU83726.1 hypothetical protein DNK31_09585 [Pseudomonas sp. FRB 228]TBU89340.1 hypothetical protein DNJ99_16535 [Pseudomonas daroniae]
MDWNTPDWRFIDTYPRHKWPSEWRWEFLRRLPEYRDDWLTRDSTMQLAQGEYCDQMRLEYEEAHPPVPEGYASFRDAMGEQGFSADGKHEERWGLRALFPPYLLRLPDEAWKEKQESTSFYSHDALVTFGSLELNERVLPEHKILIKFDLRESIDDQLLRAKNLLKELQKESEIVVGNRRLTPDEMLRYLRVLDAKESGVKNREIGEALRPPHIGEEAAKEAKRLFRTAKGVQLKLAHKLHLN